MPDASKRLIKWTIELEQFEISYKGRSAFKSQLLVDFLTELSAISIHEEKAEQKIWKLCVNGSSRDAASWASIVLTSLKGHKLNCALKAYG